MRESIIQAIELANEGRREEAVGLLRLIVRRAPSEVAAWKWLAYYTSDPQEALRAVLQVLQLNPHDRWAQEAWPELEERARRAAAARSTRHRRRPVMAAALLVAITLVLIAITGLVLYAWFGVDSLLSLSSGLLEEPLPVTQEVGPASAGLAAQANPSTPPAISGVETTVSTHYYTFEASNLIGIQQALISQGPVVDGANEHGIAMTTYGLRVSWEMQPSETACELSAARVYLDIEYTYPRWIPTGSPRPALYDAWERFIRHVVEHEEHHGAIAQECAAELVQRIEELPPQPDCQMLEATLNALVDEVYNECEARQAAFDEAEGRTLFPLP